MPAPGECGERDIIVMHRLVLGSVQGGRGWSLEAKRLADQSANQDSTLLLPFDVTWTAFARYPGDQFFASASQATLYLWDAARGVQLGLPLTGSPAEIRSLAFNKQYGVLYTGLSNGSIQAWSIDPPEWAREACLAAHRNLSSSEWDTYFPGQDYRPTCPDLK